MTVVLVCHKTSIAVLMEKIMFTQNLDNCAKECYQKWFKYLTQGVDNEADRILLIHEKMGMWGNTIMEYRKDLRKRGRGSIDNALIIKAYEDKQLEDLKNLLSEKCLECLTSNDIIRLIEELHSRKWGIEKVLNKLDKNQDMRLLRIIL